MQLLEVFVFPLHCPVEWAVREPHRVECAYMDLTGHGGRIHMSQESESHATNSFIALLTEVSPKFEMLLFTFLLRAANKCAEYSVKNMLTDLRVA